MLVKQSAEVPRIVHVTASDHDENVTGLNAGHVAGPSLLNLRDQGTANPRTTERRTNRAGRVLDRNPDTGIKHGRLVRSGQAFPDLRRRPDPRGLGRGIDDLRKSLSPACDEYQEQRGDDEERDEQPFHDVHAVTEGKHGKA